jgi:ATP-dependent Clp protease adapter protein ClpS
MVYDRYALSSNRVTNASVCGYRILDDLASKEGADIPRFVRGIVKRVMKKKLQNAAKTMVSVHLEGGGPE